MKSKILLPASVILLPESVILLPEFLDSYLDITSLIRETLLVLVCNTIKSSNEILLQDGRLLMYMSALMYPDFLKVICFAWSKIRVTIHIGREILCLPYAGCLIRGCSHIMSVTEGGGGGF